MSLIILDLDNCIADDQWRIRRIDWSETDPTARYHVYHGLAAFDRIANTDICRPLVPHDIVVFTARPSFYKAPTAEWLRRNGVNFNALFMRPNNNHICSRDLKLMFLNSLVKEFGVDPGSIACAYDDRDEVVDMYRRFGIKAEVRKIHDTCAYTCPSKIITK
jgi:hypothetical protein